MTRWIYSMHPLADIIAFCQSEHLAYSKLMNHSETVYVCVRERELNLGIAFMF